MVSFAVLSLKEDKLINRMSAMQKMQAAAGGKPLGPNGQPSPAQIEAMRVSFH